MGIFLHNTLTRSRERFEPAEPGKVSMYVCGPTVYNFAHIGNARPPVVFDVLARLLRRSYDLTYARNVTDVDDKINAAAKAEGIDISVLTARYLDAYHTDMIALGVLPPDLEPKVTEHIRPIIGMIETLIARGHAYEADSHVLFAVGSFPAYGRLSGRDRDECLCAQRGVVLPADAGAADYLGDCLACETALRRAVAGGTRGCRRGRGGSDSPQLVAVYPSRCVCC